MSELQKSLLMIGLGVIIAVYVYGWWQQRSYRRKFGTAFKAATPTRCISRMAKQGYSNQLLR